jgi:4a-hydroxytetrahydrobiopterin dehydratase
MRPKKLSEEEVAEKLSHLTGWNREGDVISKTFQFANFVKSLEFVNHLGTTAEEVQHHPDLEIRYDKVKVSLSTHDAGGITENDFKLATFAEQLSDAKTGAT